MLLWLFEQLAGYNSSFQVVRYLTLRALLSVLTALTIGLVLGPVMIRKLQALKYGQAVSSFAPENHAKKNGHTDHGRDFNSTLDWNFNLTLGRSIQSLCLDCAGSDGDFWCGGLGG